MSEQDEAQIERLAAWLMENTDEPKESYGAVDAAIHAMTEQQRRILETQQQIAAQHDEMRKAHDALVWLSAEIAWGTDGRLGTAVGHVKELIRVRDERIRELEQKLATPESLLAEVKARALEEAAERFATGEWNDAFLQGNVNDDVSAVQATEAWLKARAAEYRNGADHE